ncbi:CHAD domain-containing protein [Sphingobium sp. AN558]|uniref:CYTH and CHAD domain-containing protein n=1 Tax=Sphingobium sp. AN558 TaxID=3133442 RepID=UPI0030C3F680
MNEEVELKLELSPDAATFLEASSLLSGPMTKVDQRAVYFDTPDRTLLRHGVSLRIRQTGRKRIQTVKSNGGGHGGLISRREWEQPVSSDIPVCTPGTPLEPLLGEYMTGISPQFAVRIDRRSWMLMEQGSQIELALDRGAAIAGDRRTEICEVELELKSGDRAALFALARKIDAIVPVRPAMLSKCERGYLLLDAARKGYKAEPVELTGDLSAAAAFRSIAHNCLRHYRLNESLLLESRDVDALHQARVAIRRLRSALSIFRTTLIDAPTMQWSTELRWLARVMGTARDLDVLLERPAETMQHRLEAARDEAYSHVEAALTSERVRALVQDMVQWLAIPPTASEVAVIPLATAALHRLRRRVKKRGRHLDRLDDETRHTVRKDAKKLRYAAEFFGSLYVRKRQVRRRRDFLAALERLQSKLGAINDLVSGPDILRQVGILGDSAPTALVPTDRKLKLLAAAARSHADLVKAGKFWR